MYDARLVFGMHDIVATVSAINDEAAIEIIIKIREIPGVLSTTTLIGLKS